MNAQIFEAASRRFTDLPERLEQTEAMLEVERDEVRRTGRPAHPLATRSTWQPSRQVAVLERSIGELNAGLERLRAGP